MSRLNVPDPEKAPEASKAMLKEVHKKMGMTPNLFRVLANAPAALEGYLGLLGAMAGTSIDAGLREKVALAVAEENGCEYCLSAHTAIGGMLKVPAEQLSAAREAESANTKERAALRFAQALVRKRGLLTDGDVSELKDAGWTDGQAVELVAVTALNIFANYVGHVAEMPVDFPKVAAKVR